MTADPPAVRWSLTLYVSGGSARSIEAVAAVRRICDEYLPDRADLTVVDARDHPERVIEARVFALPTLVKSSPTPQRHLVGDFTDLRMVREGLDLGPLPPEPLAAGGGGR